MFSSDKPIRSKESDKLNRTEFSRKLAKAILSYTEIDNFTIGLCGKWGTGKTSVLNMVLEEIESLTFDCDASNKPIIVPFNPWNYSDQSQLITQFFKTVMAVLNKENANKKLDIIGKTLQNYADILDYTTYIPVAGKYLKPVKSIVSGTGKLLSGKSSLDNSLENRKKDVSKSLEELEQKIIVVIDDIDRLTNCQIRLIFQLVNSLAGFPNMIYLLSFDKSVVIRALSEEQNCNGEEYLEKIIQVPFEIPEANKSLIDEVFCNKVADIILSGIEQDTTFEIEYWQHIFPNCISPFINTMRDLNRVINTFNFKFGLMKEEINGTDLLVITTLQVCAASIYDWILNNTAMLTGSPYSTKGVSGNEQKENKEIYLNRFKSVYPENPALMLQVIQNLFPRFSWNTGGYSYSKDDEFALKHKQRIASNDRIHRYFNLSLEDIIIDKRQMLQTIYHYNANQLKEYFYSLQAGNILYDYLHELLAYLCDIPANRKFMFIQEITALRLDEKNKDRRGFLTPTIENKAANCVYYLFKENEKDENYKIITEWIKVAEKTTMPFLCEIIEYIERGYGRLGTSITHADQFIEEDKIADVEQLLLERIKVLFGSKCLFDFEGADEVKLLWSFIEKESIDKYIIQLLQIDKNIPKYLNAIASYWHSSNNSDGWSYNTKSFEDIISKEEAYSRVLKLKHTKEFSSLEHRFKQSAIAFYFWYQREDEESKMHITREEIDAEIPMWEYIESTDCN